MKTTSSATTTNMATKEGGSNSSAQRRLLFISVGGICKDVGFQGASKASLETLTEMLQAFLTELTRSCRKFCEHGHRTTPDFTDVKMALSEVGLSAHGLNLYSKIVKNQNFRILPSKQPIEHKTLKSGLPNINHPGYIPNYFPSYPDVHSFVRTPVLREPANQYEVVRERIATQKKATEESLVRFYAKTNPADVFIFEGIDSETYPLAQIATNPRPYLQALLYSNENTLLGEVLTESSEDMDTEVDSPQKNLKNTDPNSATPSGNLQTPQNPYCKPPKKLRRK